MEPVLLWTSLFVARWLKSQSHKYSSTITDKGRWRERTLEQQHCGRRLGQEGLLEERGDILIHEFSRALWARSMHLSPVRQKGAVFEPDGV